jgi:hypothetical protein
VGVARRRGPLADAWFVNETAAVVGGWGCWLGAGGWPGEARRRLAAARGSPGLCALPRTALPPPYPPPLTPCQVKASIAEASDRNYARWKAALDARADPKLPAGWRPRWDAEVAQLQVGEGAVLPWGGVDGWARDAHARRQRQGCRCLRDEPRCAPGTHCARCLRPRPDCLPAAQDWTLRRLAWMDGAFAKQAAPGAGPDAYLQSGPPPAGGGAATAAAGGPGGPAAAAAAAAAAGDPSAPPPAPPRPASG